MPASISSWAALNSLPRSSSLAISPAFRTDSWFTSQAARLGFCRPFTQSAAAGSPAMRSSFASAFLAAVNSSRDPP